jgi:hypothetical protein
MRALNLYKIIIKSTVALTQALNFSKGSLCSNHS